MVISIIVTLVTTGGIPALIGIHEWRSFGMVWYGYFQLQNHTLFSTKMDQYDMLLLGQQLFSYHASTHVTIVTAKLTPK